MLSPKWQGNWKGDCKLVNLSQAGAATTFFGMGLLVKALPTNPPSYKWHISYKTNNHNEAEVRPYEMRVTADNNHLVLDEKNGILLDVFYRASEESLVSSFTVDGTYLMSEEKLDGQKMLVKIYSFRKPVLTSSSPHIQSFASSTLQDCVLTR